MKVTVNHKRPVNLDLTSLSYPSMAIVSILHRISGVVVFLFLPLMLYFLKLSLQSPYTYTHWQILFSTTWIKIIVWVFLSAFAFHIVAGLRHVLMDVGFGEGLAAGRRSALAVIVLAIILIISLGVWLW